jgi:hypothetical protein
MKAARELRRFLAGYSLPLPVGAGIPALEEKPVALGTLGDFSGIPALRQLARAEGAALSKVTALDDAYLLRNAGDVTLVAASNDRSALYAVYRLEDWLRGDRAGGSLNVFERAHFRERWMPAAIHGRSDVPKNFGYLSRIGVNAVYLRGRYDAFKTGRSNCSGARPQRAGT